MNAIVFRERHLAIYAIDARGRSEDELFDFIIAGQLKQVQRAIDVRLCIQLRLSERRTYSGSSRQVDDAIELILIKDFTQFIAVTDVALDELKAGGNQGAFEIRPLDLR